MIVVDTNVLSETSLQNPDSNVANWLASHRRQLWMPAIVLAELRYGVEKLPASHKRTDLERWLARLTADFERRILPFDAKAAEAHGRLRARLKQRGTPMDAPDSYIAAIALSRGSPLATRNLSRFRHTDLELIDPWAG